MKNISEMSKEEQKAIMEKLAKIEERERKFKENNERRRVRNSLILEKAYLAGIEVSDEEIDAALKNTKKRAGLIKP